MNILSRGSASAEPQLCKKSPPTNGMARGSFCKSDNKKACKSAKIDSMSKAVIEYLNRDPERIRLKKNETVLVICGNGVIFFGVWSLIKSIMSVVLYNSDFHQYMAQYQDIHMFQGLVYGSVFFILAMDLFFRFYLGMSASAEVKGKKKKSNYIVLAFFVLFYTVFGLVASLFIMPPDDISILTTITTVLVEFTSALTLLQLIISAICVRKIRKSMQLEADRREGEEKEER